MPIIEVNNLSVTYSTQTGFILKDVTLELQANETVLILGASGSGKSTLALTLNGLIPNSIGHIKSGRVIVDGLDSQHGHATIIRQKAGIVFQDPSAQFVTLLVEDEIVFGLENLRILPEKMNDIVDNALAQVNMSDARRQSVSHLSGGEKQAVALAALLAMQPEILIFDEPTSNIDPTGTKNVFSLIERIKKKRKHTIVIIEHKLDDLIHLVDRVVVLGHEGVIIADGSPLDIFKDQYEVLLNHGIWIPEVCMFAHDLQRSGLELDPFPLTLDAAHTAISSVFSGQSSLVGTQMPTARNVDANTAIEVRNLTFSYGAKQILNSISLDIAAGDFVALIGANGAGKTTLAQTIMGILTPLSGTIYINGEAAANLPANQIVEQIGYVFQNPEHQFITNTVFDEIAYALRVRGLDQASVQKKTEDMLVRFALSEYKGKSPFMLSHGEKRRLSVATMLAMGQSILIFDEPTFGQDQQNADAIMSLLSDLHAGGCTVIIITHDMRLVAEYANHVVVLNQGHILFNGLPQDMFAQADLLREAHLQLPPMAELATRLNIPMVITRQQLQDTVVAQLGS